MSVLDIQAELLHLEYPFLLPDHDPEIERYYEYRALGRSQDALYLYQNRLKFRYPDDEFRTNLMRSYRSHNPAYKILLEKAYRSLGERSLDRIKRIIEYIAAEAESYNEKDVYSTIKAAENILRVLPRERFEAVAGIERYHRYAQHLNFKVKSTFKASELVRAYLTESLSVVEEERRRQLDLARRAKAMERERLVKADWANYEYQKKYGHGHPMVDLSSIVFSGEDLERIEINKNITKLEDQTLAYCVKYWKLTDDPAFERILFLYSRKYGSKHYDIYMTIRRGQAHKNRDDEILASVLSALVTGYYYSIQGDIYLQRSWNRIKASLSLDEKEKEAVPAELPEVKQQKKKPKARKKAGGKKIPKRKKSRTGSGKSGKAVKAGTTVSRKKAVSAGTGIAVEPVKKKTGKRETPGGKSGEAKKVGQESAVGKISGEKTGQYKNAVKKRKPMNRGYTRQEQAELPGSVKDRLQELSGRSYDLYQERFLANARFAIRKVLGAGKGIFYAIPEEVEDIIYNFLKDHYSDPYMNWAESSERKQLKEKGFGLESLNAIIDECYKSLL